MGVGRRWPGVLFAVALALAMPARAGTWTYERDSRDQPELSYVEDGKPVFSIGCGRAFGLHANIPGRRKRRASLRASPSLVPAGG